MEQGNVKITRFLGVRNTLPGDQMPPTENGVWLQSADNLDIDNAGRAKLRQGCGEELGFGDVTAAFNTNDEQRLFVVDDGDLKEVDALSPLQTRTLKAGVGSDEMYWAEAGNMIFFAGSSTGIISKTECLPFGIESPEPPTMAAIAGSLPAGRYLSALVYRDEYGREGGCGSVSEITLNSDGGIQFTFTVPSGFTALLFVSYINGDQLYLLAEATNGNYLWTAGEPSSQLIEDAQINTYPPPEGIKQLCFADSRLWVAETDGDTSYIYRSKPFWYHLFDLMDHIAVNGAVEMLLSVGNTVIIGTANNVWAYNEESGLSDPLPYGVVPGKPGMIIGGYAYFWTKRGYCRGFPFENLTDDIYSVPPGSRVSVGLNESKGRKMLIAATDTSGEANNSYN